MSVRADLAAARREYIKMHQKMVPDCMDEHCDNPG